jgi:predicted nucleic acid-binding protein
MPDKRVFLDTNVWVYLFAASQDAEDQRKKHIARQVLLDCPDVVVSVQVFNELSNVWLRKYQLKLDRVELYLRQIGEIAEMRLLDETLTFQALKLLQTYKLSFYDSLIIATALDTDCELLLSEDMQDGQRIENRLTIRNPFR